MTLQHQRKPNALHDLGYKIFLDRYAQKDMTRATLAVGDTVIVVVNSQTGQREIGKVTALALPQVTVELNDGETVIRDLEHVDKPLETDPGQMMDRVAAGIAAIEATPELREAWTDNFRWLLDDWKFVPGGRILTGAGTDQKLTYYNCYVIPSPQDSREGIMNTLTYMTEIMSRGGGVGINLSTLRPRHAYVKGVNGRSSGAVSWGGLYSFVTGLIEQGGSRRGALMLILNDWHPDVFSFISSKRTAGQITNANISVGVSNKLMDAVRSDGDWTLMFPDTSDPDYNTLWDGDIDKWQALGKKAIHYKTVKAKEVWNAIIESAWASAEPGIWFRERSNEMSNSHYFSTLISTNPCLTGDTRLYTDQGLVTLQELFDEETEFKVAVDSRFGIGNFFLPSTRVFMTGIKPVFRLQTREGYSVRATADHRFMTQQGWKELRDLKPGDALHVMNRKGGFGQQGSLELGRVLGWLVGDGTIKQDRAVLSFFGPEKQELAPVFAQYVDDLVTPLTSATATRASYKVGVVAVGGRDEARVQSERLRTLVAQYGLVEKKHQVPEIVFKGTEDMQRGFLQALFTADGSIQGSAQKGLSIRLASSVLPLLEQVQMLLSNFGLVSRIYKNRRKEQMRSMRDGKGGYKEYLTKAQHELVLSSTSLVAFMEDIGFLMEYKNETFKKLRAEYAYRPYPSLHIAVVESITPDGEEAVYDLTVDQIHANIVNGIVSHNCGEQPLSAWSVCNLGAINLSRFYDEVTQDVDWKTLDRTVRYATRFLDNIIDGTPYFFDQNRQTQLDERRVGLGTMGIAELMIKCKVRYGSDESVEFIDKVYKAIATAAYETSAQLAVEKGAFPKFDADRFLESGFMEGMPDNIRKMVKECGIRNVTLLTQAPTGTTGTMVNASTGIEPFFSWVYYRKSRLGLHEERMPIAQEWFDANPGETQLPEYFVTAMELAPEDHVKVQGAFQRWVDSAISKTCNVPNNYTVEQVGKLYEMMYDLGCKGGTIYRDGSRDEQVLMLKGDERAESEMADLKKKEAEKPVAVEEKTEAPATPHRVYSRPTILHGTTVSFKTPFGTSYITMNSDENGCPFEVFITVGKAGSDVQADAEALGRLISLQLRATAPQNRMEMLKLVIDQLQNIGGARPVGFGIQRVLSLPDAVARALEMHYVNVEEPPHQLVLPGLNGNGKSKPALARIEVEEIAMAQSADDYYGSKPVSMSGADMCPECGTISLVRAEGCRRCLTCEYTEC